jgi:hypothetical protein
VQCNYNNDSSSVNSIKLWCKNFLETGSIKDRPHPGHPSVYNESMEQIQESFLRSPRKSVRRASHELQISCSTAH